METLRRTFKIDELSFIHNKATNKFAQLRFPFLIVRRDIMENLKNLLMDIGLYLRSTSGPE